jgi:hypothetical protein
MRLFDITATQIYLPVPRCRDQHYSIDSRMHGMIEAGEALRRHVTRQRQRSTAFARMSKQPLNVFSPPQFCQPIYLAIDSRTSFIDTG